MSLPFEYILKRKRGMKTVRVALKKNTIVVSAPKWIPKKAIELFLWQKQARIQEGLKKLQQEANKLPVVGSYDQYAKRAKKLITDRVKMVNSFYNFEFERITIKRHETRWGSCSTKKNLNFNYKLYFLPVELVDYVVAHELCHLKQMNHSKQFWALVESFLPDYTLRRHELKKYHI